MRIPLHMDGLCGFHVGLQVSSCSYMGLSPNLAVDPPEWISSIPLKLGQKDPRNDMCGIPRKAGNTSGELPWPTNRTWKMGYSGFGRSILRWQVG